MDHWIRRRDITYLWGFRQSELNQSPRLKRLDREIHFARSKSRYDSYNDADQTARMRRLVCAFFVRKLPNTCFLAYCKGPDITNKFIAQLILL